jgi:hypothetical protein
MISMPHVSPVVCAAMQKHNYQLTSLSISISISIALYSTVKSYSTLLAAIAAAAAVVVYTGKNSYTIAVTKNNTIKY